MSIKEFFSSIATKIRAFFGTTGGQVVKDALGVLLHEITAAGLSILFDVARNKAVQVEALNTIGGDAKFDAVKQAVTDAARKEGINVANRTLETIVQLAAQAVTRG